MNKLLKNLFSVVAILSLITVAFYAGMWVGGNFEQEKTNNYLSSSDPQLSTLFSPFFQAWDIVHDQYVDQPVDDVKLMQGAISGMMSGLGDIHSSYMDPETYRQANAPLQGGYTGIGAWVDTSGDSLIIVAPMPDSPAEAADLQPGDTVIGIDGEDVTGIAPDIVLQSILGPADTEVVLTMTREGVEEPFDVSITRAEIEIPVLQYEMLENNIAYINLYQFSINAGEELQAALEELLAQEPVGIILDLRDNTGGYLDAAIDITSFFIEDGPIMIEEWGDGTDHTYDALGNAIAPDLPLVVLVNGGSASASEITAGAIQDRGRGTLVGTTTYGKGSVQNWIELDGDNGAIRVTVARWLTPDRKQINGIGLTPDLEVDYTQEDFDAGIDPQMDKAIELILGYLDQTL
ncbi:MAG: Carboxy-terminal-processing protease [Anaerolinea thermophila]|uniref:Carboxy-terminal-processing protease n=1 Tax=Anaerolinea thermophila TaxID=167964 RepID=A0A117LGQ7_9CHLR|nr:MAG: Carboxy-terminal-processing protease [Anaerolinea thermophila]